MTKKPAHTTEPAFPMRWLSFALALEMCLMAVGLSIITYGERVVRETTERQIRLERLRGDITHLDEVLTMSTRMAAASGDPQWEARYHEHEPLLDAMIREAVSLQGQVSVPSISETDEANQRLVAMEQAAFAHVRAGNLAIAEALLESDDYQQNKQRYMVGLNELLAQLDREHAKVVQSQRDLANVIQIGGGMTWTLLLVVWVGVIIGIRRWRAALMAVRQELARAQNRLENRVRAMARDLTRVEHRERKRIATLLHDHLQQLLVAARLKVRLFGDRPELEPVSDLLAESLEASRSLTVELSPPALLSGGLNDGVQWLSDWMDRTHALEVQFRDRTEHALLDAEVELIAFDSVREILFNVVKHAEVDVALVEMDDNEAGGANIIISDQGVGFDPTSLDIGDHFGLIKTTRRLELIGGELKVTTAPGKGCRVRIRLPVREVQPKVKTVSPSVPPSSTQSFTAPCRIVLVEDHPIVRDGLVALLKTETHLSVIGEATSYQEAIDTVRRTEPDLAIIDVSLGPNQPGGAEVAVALRAIQPNLKLIALSSHSDNHTKARMKDAGVQQFLVKGCSTDEILGAIYREFETDTAHEQNVSSPEW